MSDDNNAIRYWLRQIPNDAPPICTPQIPLSRDDETAPSDSDNAQAITEANPQQFGSTASVVILEYLDRFDRQTLCSHGLFRFIRTLIPNELIYRHPDRQDIAPTFEWPIAQHRGIGISVLDIELCSRMEGKEIFKPGNCHAQFETSGLCVEMLRGAPLPTPSPTTVKFSLGRPRRGRYFSSTLRGSPL